VLFPFYYGFILNELSIIGNVFELLGDYCGCRLNEGATNELFFNDDSSD